MEKTQISNLKRIVKPGTMLVSPAGDFAEITAVTDDYMIFRDDQISWQDLVEYLASGEYDFEDLTIENPVSTWGGRRVAGPGKNLGRPVLDEDAKRKPVSISLTDLEKRWLKNVSGIMGLSMSSTVSRLLDDYINANASVYNKYDHDHSN